MHIGWGEGGGGRVICHLMDLVHVHMEGACVFGWGERRGGRVICHLMDLMEGACTSVGGREC